MKTYWRIVNYARPFSRFLPQYILVATMATLFGLCNFTLIIPLLNVLFEQTGAAEVQAVAGKPEFSLTIGFVKESFRYYFGQVVTQYGKVGALLFVCVLVLVSVFLSNLFRYLALRRAAAGARGAEYAPGHIRAHHGAATGLFHQRAQRRPDDAPDDGRAGGGELSGEHPDRGLAGAAYHNRLFCDPVYHVCEAHAVHAAAAAHLGRHDGHADQAPAKEGGPGGNRASAALSSPSSTRRWVACAWSRL